METIDFVVIGAGELHPPPVQSTVSLMFNGLSFRPFRAF